MQRRGALKGGVVATVLSNLGLKTFLKAHGIAMAATKVGDRFVLEQMQRDGWNIGGEQSGHVILTDHATTGDGELTAVTFLQVLKQSGKKASELAGQIEKFPPSDDQCPCAQRPEKNGG